ncbi:MAG: type II secretion system protein N [Limnohabitans sp.]
MQSRPPPNPAQASTRWAWLGVALGLSSALVTQAPAYWLAQWVAVASDQRMLLQDPQGTVWNGSAQWVLNEGPRNQDVATTSLPTRVTWQLGPHLDWSAQRLGFSASVASACCTPQPLRIDVSPLWQGLRVQVHDQSSQWPAAWLVGLGAPWNTVQPEGVMQLQTTRLVWEQRGVAAHVNGQAELQLRDVATRLSTLRPLGTYRVRVQGGDTMALTLDTLAGSLQLQGTGQWQQGRLQFNGEATAAPDAQDALSNLLNVLGQRQGNKSILKMG